MDRSVSVVIPSYNSARLLPDAIRSVRAQGWRELEIIIVDDGSEDETPAVLEEVAGDDLRVFRQANGGPAAARNLGVSKARNCWIAFLDADDQWLDAKLQSQFDALLQNPEFAFSYTNSVIVDDEGTEKPQVPNLSHKHLLFDLLLGPQFAMGSVVTRRECFDRVGAFDTELRTGEDWDMWLRLAAEYKSVYVPRTLLRIYRGREVKYPLELLERCNLRVVNRLFYRMETSKQWSCLTSQRRQLYAWHYSVLAKSYLRQGRIKDFCRLGLDSIAAHPSGLLFLRRRWSRGSTLPHLSGLD